MISVVRVIGEIPNCLQVEVSGNNCSSERMSSFVGLVRSISRLLGLLELGSPSRPFASTLLVLVLLASLALLVLLGLLGLFEESEQVESLALGVLALLELGELSGFGLSRLDFVACIALQWLL